MRKRCFCGFPGFLCPGLIEALMPRRVQLPLFHGFPGFLCPGLIEAIPARQRAPRRRPVVFRGFYAPASLKPGVVGMTQLNDQSFPGFLCPGLIEATTSTLPRSTESSVFRGFYAPASLKLAHDAKGEAIIPYNVFRGFYAPASLKPSPRSTPIHRWNCVFRGFYAPASLKPATGDAVSNVYISFSGVFMPRPH